MKTPEEIIRKIPKNSKIILAFSGGPDSVYLLNKLLKTDLKIIIAHFNHKLRGRDSEVDQNFAQKIAKKYKLDFESESFDVKKYAKSSSMNLEEAAREKRYEFLKKILKKHNAKFILTGHHANDNLETFLINFLRGSGADGLTAIQIQNKEILRPLLEISKNEILKYLKDNNCKFRLDKTNEDTKILRNRLRKYVINELEKIQPELITVFNRNIKNLNEIYQINKRIINEWLKKNQKNENEISLNSFNNLTETFIKQLIIALYKQNYNSTRNLTSAAIIRCLKLIKEKKTGKNVPFGNKLTLNVISGKIKIIPKTSIKNISRKRLTVPGKTKFEYGEIVVENLKKFPANPKTGIFLDYSKLKFPLYIRKRRDGDKIKPFGLNGTKKINDFLSDKKIPFHERTRIPLITDKNDEILAVGNLTINDNYKIRKSNNANSPQYLEILIKTAKL